MICDSYFRFFETVSSKTRWEILRILKKRPMSVTEICGALKEEQSKVSHNLRNLKACRFLDSKKEGKKRIYFLNKETIVPLMKLVERHVERYCKDFCRVMEK